MSALTGVRPGFAAPLPAVDRVERVGERTLLATKRVRADDPYMPGHFPGLTMYPAVFLVETVRQAVAAADPACPFPQVHAVRSARLLAPMLGGAELSVHIEVGGRTGAGPFPVAARCVRDDGVAAATLKLDLVDGDQPAPEEEPGHAPPVPAPGGGAGSGAAVLDHARIRGLLPLGHPMVLVDRVTALVPGERIATVKAVTGSEPCYQGLPADLPPQRFTYPVSLVMESFGQSAALLWTTGDADPDGVLMLAVLRDLRITGVARPGDVLRHEIRLEKVYRDSAFLTGETTVDGRPIATMGSLVAVRRPRTTVTADSTSTGRSQ